MSVNLCQLESHVKSWGELCRVVNGMFGHDRHDRIPAGDGVVGSKHEWLSIGWHLDRAADHGRAWQLHASHACKCGTSESHANAIAVCRDDVLMLHERGKCIIDKE